MNKVVIFASGTGSNAEAIIRHFKEVPDIEVAGVFSNKQNSGALAIGQKHNLATFLFDKQELSNSDIVLKKLQELKVSHIVLAGFLLKVPESIISEYPNRILNIHPSLLPKYGGKGMYGMNVHRAVKEANESKTGITIHLVDKNYDEGSIIGQYEVSVDPNETMEEIAANVRALEHKFYPKTIESWVRKS